MYSNNRKFICNRIIWIFKRMKHLSLLKGTNFAFSMLKHWKNNDMSLYEFICSCLCVVCFYLLNRIAVYFKRFFTILWKQYTEWFVSQYLEIFTTKKIFWKIGMNIERFFPRGLSQIEKISEWKWWKWNFYTYDLKGQGSHLKERCLLCIFFIHFPHSVMWSVKRKPPFYYIFQRK